MLSFSLIARGTHGTQSASGAHGRCCLPTIDLDKAGKPFEQEAMLDDEMGSGWIIKAIRALIEEHFNVRYG